MDCGLRVAGTDCGLQDKDGLGGLVPVVSLSLVMLLGATSRRFGRRNSGETLELGHSRQRRPARVPRGRGRCASPVPVRTTALCGEDRSRPIADNKPGRSRGPYCPRFIASVRPVSPSQSGLLRACSQARRRPWRAAVLGTWSRRPSDSWPFWNVGVCPLSITPQ